MENKEKDCKVKRKLAYRLPSYRPASILFRFIAISIFSVLTLWFIVWVVSGAKEISQIPFFYYFIIVSFFMVASEIQILLDNILEYFFPVPKKLRLRLSIQFISNLTILGIVHKLIMIFFDPTITDMQARPGVYLGLIIGLFVIYLMAQAIIISRLTEKLLDSQKEVGEMKQEKLRMDYSALQDQLNPHFLFNNLSVLKSLIIYDKDKAVTFTENFTDVYRYVLQSSKKQLVSLKDELVSLESYLALHMERLGKGLVVKSTISKEAVSKDIPPLTLQLLVENAIKHNIASEDIPLRIEILADKDQVIVKNNIQARDTSYSTQTGLGNLMKRFEILASKRPIVESNGDFFTVKIPLI